MDSRLILAEIQRNGVALQNQFEIVFDLPLAAYREMGFRAQIDSELFNATQRISVSCEQIDIPGKLIPTQEMRHYQIRRKFPYGILMEDIQATMRVSADMFERKFFEAWTNLIQNPLTRNFNYHNEYTTNFDIYQRDKSGQLVYGVRLYEAYPFSIVQLSGDQSAENQYYRQNVTLTYTNWEPIDIRDDLYQTYESRRMDFPNPIGILRNILTI